LADDSTVTNCFGKLHSQRHAAAKLQDRSVIEAIRRLRRGVALVLEPTRNFCAGEIL
jgi:hypothetical protein